MYGINPSRIVALLVALALFANAGAVQAEEFDESFTFDATTLRVSNLIGAISVEGHDGSGFEVVAHVRGDDASRDEIQFETEEGRGATLEVVFPDEDRFVYPELGRRSRMSFNMGRGDDWGWFRRDRIEIRGSGRGMEVWVDLTVKVPRGSELVVRHGAGTIEAVDAEAHIDLAIRSGHASATRITGDVEIDTGSGHVEIDTIVGNLRVDTGSGHVEAVNVDGERIALDTGSGHVSLHQAKGDKLEIDTGSGRVELDEGAFTEISIDTGSGGVECDTVEADELTIDTGSGSVRVELVRMGDGNFSVDTGSGSIRFFMPEPASAEVWAETSSGGIDVDVRDADMKRKKRDEVEFVVGEGTARVELETGSGSIRIAAR